MITPPYLKHGDKIGVVSTAKQASFTEIEDGLTLLKSWGLTPIVGNNAFNTYGFLAGTDTERLHDLQQMLDDETIKAILFTKGGYGTMKIIDALDFTAFIRNPKWIVGYSDITVLHNHLHNFNIETIHAVMLQGMPKCSSAGIASLKNALFGMQLVYELPQVTDNKNATQLIEGVVVGGNLSILYALIGSPSDIDTTNKILFFEDIDEYRYHFDRMLLALKRAGKLAQLKAIIVGELTDIKEATINYGLTANQILLDQTNTFNYPIYFGFPAGHQSDNRALILGRSIKIIPTSTTVRFEF